MNQDIKKELQKIREELQGKINEISKIEQEVEEEIARLANNEWIPTWRKNPEETLKCEVTFEDGTTGFATWIKYSDKADIGGLWYKEPITERAYVKAWRVPLEPYEELDAIDD